VKLRLEVRRGSENPIKRLLFNLRQQNHNGQIPEVKLWTYQDVETMYNAFVLPESARAMSKNIKYRITRINPDEPYTPSNAKIEIMSGADPIPNSKESIERQIAAKQMMVTNLLVEIQGLEEARDLYTS
jgi:hypothetical protein